jgi:hypothetical protein
VGFLAVGVGHCTHPRRRQVPDRRGQSRFARRPSETVHRHRTIDFLPRLKPWVSSNGECLVGW